MTLKHRSFYFLFTFLLSCATFAQDFEALEYRTIGPARGGRVTTVTGTAMLPGTFYFGATGAGVGILGLGTQQVIEPLSQVANPIDSLLGKGTGWLLIVGAVILLIVGLLFKR